MKGRARAGLLALEGAAASPKLPILYRETAADAVRVRRTAVYAFVKSETLADGRAGEAE